jgi:hypothetical protein
VRHLAVVVGAAFELPVPLSVSRIDANVTVIADATVLEAARSQIAATVSEAEVRSLSMNGRNFLELALLAPGVSPTNVASTHLFPETSAVPASRCRWRGSGTRYVPVGDQQERFPSRLEAVLEFSVW